MYRSSICGHQVLLKHRFSKQYRHPALDGTLTKARVAAEARAILRCLKYIDSASSPLIILSRSGVNVPGVRIVDASEGVIGLEWIDGDSVRKLLPGGADDEDEETVLLASYQLSIGTPQVFVFKFVKTLSRQAYGPHWHGNRQNAPGRHHPRRPHNIKYDATPHTHRTRTSN